MKSGYKIKWTPHAIEELEETIEYLEQEFSEKELNKLANEIEDTVRLISQNPKLFPKSEFKKVHRAVILKYNTMYYRTKGNEVEILSFFSNRKKPMSNI